jgi:hypothetical protein
LYRGGIIRADIPRKHQRECIELHTVILAIQACATSRPAANALVSTALLSGAALALAVAAKFKLKHPRPTASTHWQRQVFGSTFELARGEFSHCINVQA